MTTDDRYLAFMGLGPKRMPHWEHWSCPDAETYLTGIDYYKHPRLCRLKLQELYPELGLGVPEGDEPRPRPQLDPGDNSSAVDEHGRHSIRWGDTTSWHWDWGKNFRDVEEVLAFSPLEHADFTDVPVVESRDYSDEERLYESYRRHFPAEQGVAVGVDAGEGVALLLEQDLIAGVVEDGRRPARCSAVAPSQGVIHEVGRVLALSDRGQLAFVVVSERVYRP